MSKTKPMTSFEILGYLLGQFGDGKMTREVFWKEMNARGYTQGDIDKWCASFYELENKKDQDNEARRKETESRTARGAVAGDARGEDRSEREDRREEREGDEQGVQRQGDATQDQDARQEDGGDSEARQNWEIIDGEIWITLTQGMMDFVDPIAERQTLARIRSGARQGNGGPEGEASIPLRVQQAKNGLRAEAIARRFFGTAVPWSIMSDQWGTPDFSDFIDVKSRMNPRYGMHIKPKNDPQRAYLMVCGVHHPRWRIVGWCWGHEARDKGEWMTFGESGDPCWIVNEDNLIMQDPFVLREMALARNIE